MNNQKIVKENQKINNFPKKAAAYNLSDYYQEIFDFLTKKPGERYPKWLMEEIDKKKENWRNILEDKKKEFSKKVKLLLYKTQHFKAIKKFKIFEDLIDNKTYLLIWELILHMALNWIWLSPKKIPLHLISLLLKNQEIIKI